MSAITDELGPAKLVSPCTAMNTQLAPKSTQHQKRRITIYPRSVKIKERNDGPTEPAAGDISIKLEQSIDKVYDDTEEIDDALEITNDDDFIGDYDDDHDNDDDFASLVGSDNIEAKSKEINDDDHDNMDTEHDNDAYTREVEDEQKVTRSGRIIRKSSKVAIQGKRKAPLPSTSSKKSVTRKVPVRTKRTRLMGDTEAKIKTFADDIDDGEEQDEEVGFLLTYTFIHPPITKDTVLFFITNTIYKSFHINVTL